MAQTVLPAEAQPIVDRYAAICRRDYFENLRHCISGLQNAAKALEDAEAILRCCPIDAGHWSDATEIPSRIILRTDGDRQAIQRDLRDAAVDYEQLAFALETATDANGKNKSRRQVPASVYVEATKELMALYEDLHNQGLYKTPLAYPDPRAQEDGESTQESVHFVAQCLQAIDPACDVKMAITCIRNARDWGRIPDTNVRIGETINVV